MNIIPNYFILSFTALALFSAQQSATSSHEYSIIGAILDNTTRAGREAKVSIDIAFDEFSTKTNQSFVLRIINSSGDPASAALAAAKLIDSEQAQAILGPHTWEEASRVVEEVGNRGYIPTLSLADSTPTWATEQWPFLVQASLSNQDAQMKAVAAIVQSWEWHRVTLIYEDNLDSASDGAIPNLFEALREAGAEISHFVPLPPFHYSSMAQELKRLKRDQCRVFVVHTSLKLAIHLFQNANEMQMMGKGYVWITTNTVTDLLHSLNASIISSMQGVVGVKTYFPESRPKFLDFKKRFRKNFSVEYPEEENNEPGISALEAYDAMWVVALALDEGKMQVDSKGQQFLEKVSLIDFNGMTGRVHFIERKLAPANVFVVVNVIGKSYRELGVWYEGLGFSRSTDDKAIYNSSMQNLGQVIWPGEPRYTPKGWTLPTSTNFLKVGVPAESMFKQFVNILYDPLNKNFSSTGFAIEIFKETMDRLPYYVPYEFSPFIGTYDSLVEQVYLKKFDAVVGDVAVVARRCEYAEFTHTYSDSVLVMIVPFQSKMPHKAWLFMKPFTKSMWALILAITIYNGFVIWLIERNHNPRLKGSALDQTGIVIWLSFTTLFSLHGGKLHSNLSRMAIVVWLFVALIITQSYTASLTSMLTVQKLKPTVDDIETLKNNNAIVGYGKGGFVARYLEDVLGFKSNNIKNFSSPQEYAQALKTGEIAAVFLNGAYGKLFLAKYCKSFMVAGPTYKVGGFGFVFPKGSPMLADINKALLDVFESGKLRQLEQRMIGSEKCVEVESSDDEDASLSLNSFWILFVLTGGTSTCALAIYAMAGLRIVYNTILEKSNILSIILKHWGHQRRRFLRKVSDAESLRNSSMASNM